MRILIVAETQIATDEIAALVRKIGRFDTRSAVPAASAPEIAAAFLPNVVFLDVDLPDAEGYRLASALSQHPELRKTRLIALTQSTETADRARALQAGFERYVAKPVTQSALEKVLLAPPLAPEASQDPAAPAGYDARSLNTTLFLPDVFAS